MRLLSVIPVSRKYCTSIVRCVGKFNLRSDLDWFNLRSDKDITEAFFADAPGNGKEYFCTFGHEEETFAVDCSLRS